MNKIYRTIWNAVRGQVVVVNEACSGHAQADGSGRKTGTSTVRKTSFRGALLALAVAGCFGAAPSFGAFADYTEEWDNDFPSASQTHYNNYTVNQGVTVTINKGIDEGDGSYLENPSALFTVDGTLTNKGTIANDRKDMPWQIGGMIDNQAGASFSASIPSGLKQPPAAVPSPQRREAERFSRTPEPSTSSNSSARATSAIPERLNSAATTRSPEPSPIPARPIFRG